jgi:hypothetical protein
VNAQTITGVVCDYTTKHPISDVSIYLSGTSLNTVTDTSGKFELISNSIINTKLVVHHLLYETVLIDYPFQEQSDTIFIKEKINVINELTVSADRFTREQKMKAFRGQFLGMSTAGKSCIIVNEDDVHIVIDMQARRLIATSDKPIIVKNNYLSYEISFLLIDFWIQYGFFIVSLYADYVQSSFFAVVSSFTDLSTENRNRRRTDRRRDNTYQNSYSYFFKSLTNNELKDNNFKIFNNSLEVDYQRYFAIKDTLSQKMLNIIPDTDINRTRGFNNIPEPSGVINVLHRRRIRSDIYFLTDSLLVDKYGNINQIDKILFSGQMGENRAGDLLPLNYERRER